jgi:hypothetical protein
MKKIIYKFELDSRMTRNELSFHEGFIPIHTGLDPNGIPCIWCIVNPQAPLVPVTVFVFGTGEYFEEAEFTTHIGSFMERRNIWHVFI